MAPGLLFLATNSRGQSLSALKGRPRRSHVACEMAGVAGFEPAASSSRTVGTVKRPLTMPSSFGPPGTAHNGLHAWRLLYLAVVLDAFCYARSGVNRFLTHMCQSTGVGYIPVQVEFT